MCARAATLVVALVLQAASLAPAPRRAVVYRGEEDIDVDAVAASLQSRGLEPDVVDTDSITAALAQPNVAAIYAGRYASHEALDALEATKPLYRYEKSAGAFKLDRRCEIDSDAPPGFAPRHRSSARAGAAPRRGL